MFQGSNPFRGLGVLLAIGVVGCLAAVVFSWWVSLWIAIPLTVLAVLFLALQMLVLLGVVDG